MQTSSLPLIDRHFEHPHRTALHTSEGSFTYGDLLEGSASVAARLLAGEADLNEGRVAFLVPPGFDYVAVQWGIWRAGGVAVPLALSHPAPELDHTIGDCDAGLVVAHPTLAEQVRAIVEQRGLTLLTTDQLLAPGSAEATLPSIEPDRRAMILYTSGTTSRPKGAVSTHANIQAQVETLVAAWRWTRDDHTLLVLPLHHVHGIINVLGCALWSGARCTVHPSFDAGAVWGELTTGDLTLFMAVPTIYGRLIIGWDAAEPAARAAMSAGCQRLRLMVSGSAALPVSVLERWLEISGHTLLERYGMTEIGMALSNPLDGERRPGHVGVPLPGVEVRLVEDSGEVVGDETPGEIEVRGPSVFREYWRLPQATEQSFRDGWFRTGDVAEIVGGYFRILGRSSVDILKTGGYKVSALEIEEVLRTHPAVAECAVVGVPDEEWGDRVCAALVLRPEEELTSEQLRAWAAGRLAPYKVPREVKVVEELPRNAMGKVVKPELRGVFGNG
jgi:malonyl-CoA/methylmalonyl-CoA synthetase